MMAEKIVLDAQRGASIVSKEMHEEPDVAKRRGKRAVAYALWYRDERLK